MSDGRYVRFTPKVDDGSEVISAEHINTLQDASERTQQGLFKAQDRDFLDKALFILEHHRGVNGLWLDLFENVSKIDLPKTRNLVFSEVEQGVVFPDGSDVTYGTLYSTTYVNPNQSNMQKVMVIAAGNIPDGTSIIIEVSNNAVDWYELPLSDSELFEMPTTGSKITLRATFTRTAGAPSPRLDAWALLYYDVKTDIIEMPDGTQVVITDPTDPTDYDDIVKIMHHQLMGIGPNDHHPQEHTHDGTDGSGTISHDSLTDIGEDDHHDKDHIHGEDGVSAIDLSTGSVIGTLPTENLSYQVWTGKPGKTGLYFDPMLNDRLVYVKTPDDETYLFYDLVNDRLSHTITIREGIAVWETMLYGEYTTSTGEVNVVLQGTNKEMFDATDAVIQNEIDKITAPDAPTGLVATDPGTGGRIDLSWNLNSELDLAGYNIFMSLDAGVTWTMVNTSGVISTPNFSVDGLTDGRTYIFAVTAIDTLGYQSPKSMGASGTPTLADTIAPVQVTGLNVSSIGVASVAVEWNANAEVDMANYYVYRSNSGVAGSFSKVQTLAQPTNVYYDTGVLTGNTYFYYVTAVDTNGNESVPSIIASVIA
jgi:hypothetical protein